MALLMTQSCWALAAQALLVDFNLCAEGMPEYYDCCGKFRWPGGEPEDWEVTWELAPYRATEDFAS
jgi:hypothetical protein